MKEGLFRVEIIPSLITQFFIKDDSYFIRILKGIPKDSEFQRAYYDSATNCFNIVFKSKEIQEVPERCAIPIFNLEFEKVTYSESISKITRPEC
jgi:hypothetical protein